MSDATFDFLIRHLGYEIPSAMQAKLLARYVDLTRRCKHHAFSSICRPMFGLEGNQFGYEWRRNAFDAYADKFLLLKFVNDHAGKTALDIGCGNGRRVQDLLALNLFDIIYASDIVLRSFFQNASNQVTEPIQSTSLLKFVQKSVVDLNPTDFDGTTFDYINCRNVLHFVSPADFRKALHNIATLATEGALVTLSFDEVSYIDDPLSILHDDNPRFYDNETTAYASYYGSDVESYMTDIGFEILPLNLNLEPNPKLRQVEHHIAAWAPGPKAIKPQNG